jgi:hypothetical protein
MFSSLFGRSKPIKSATPFTNRGNYLKTRIENLRRIIHILQDNSTSPNNFAIEYKNLTIGLDELTKLINSERNKYKTAVRNIPNYAKKLSINNGANIPNNIIPAILQMNTKLANLAKVNVAIATTALKAANQLVNTAQPGSQMASAVQTQRQANSALQGALSNQNKFAAQAQASLSGLTAQLNALEKQVNS